ncbi:hypothetical protein C5O80_21290 [Burkholderia sp. SRS-46]|nr:hypothetical protein C5O80_21290 [Burkholderia sp. SRS-46]
MAYNIQQVQGPAPLAVGERFWGDATEINFGAMTSCIALIEQTPGKPTSVRGIHLSIVSADGTPVYDPASKVAEQVDKIMTPNGNLRACLGRIDLWQGSDAKQLKDFFVGLMKSLGIIDWVPLPDGNLRVRFQNGTIQYQQGNAGWVNVPYA